VKRAGVRGKKRGSGKATVPGRKRRRQIEVVRSAEAECALRLEQLPRRLEKLEADRVTEMMADDAIGGNNKATRLLLKMLGLFGGVEEDEAPRRNKRRRGRD
jgi:hypothetical protein